MLILRLLTVLYTMVSGSILLAESSYPETRDERRSKEIGSVLGGEGLVFRPGKIPNLSTQTPDSKINKYLWQATLDVVDFAPIITSDAENGIVVTDWYTQGKDKNRSLKLKVEILGNVINPESIKTELQQRVRQNGTWVEDNSTSHIQTEIEDKILRRARQLYLRGHKK